jgi:hypothetical protein
VDSTSDDSCHTHLIETMETLPLKTFVERIAFKVLGNCVKMSQATDNPDIKLKGIESYNFMFCLPAYIGPHHIMHSSISSNIVFHFYCIICNMIFPAK